MLFLIYAILGMSDAYICFLIRSIEMINTEVEFSILHFITLIISWCFFGVYLGIVYIAFFQFSLIRTNTTSMERSIRKWQQVDAKEINQVKFFNFKLFWKIQSIKISFFF